MTKAKGRPGKRERDAARAWPEDLIWGLLEDGISLLGVSRQLSIAYAHLRAWMLKEPKRAAKWRLIRVRRRKEGAARRSRAYYDRNHPLYTEEERLEMRRAALVRARKAKKAYRDAALSKKDMEMREQAAELLAGVRDAPSPSDR